MSLSVYFLSVSLCTQVWICSRMRDQLTILSGSRYINEKSFLQSFCKMANDLTSVGLTEWTITITKYLKEWEVWHRVRSLFFVELLTAQKHLKRDKEPKQALFYCKKPKRLGISIWDKLLYFWNECWTLYENCLPTKTEEQMQPALKAPHLES